MFRKAAAGFLGERIGLGRQATPTCCALAAFLSASCTPGKEGPQSEAGGVECSGPASTVRNGKWEYRTEALTCGDGTARSCCTATCLPDGKRARSCVTDGGECAMPQVDLGPSLVRLSAAVARIVGRDSATYSGAFRARPAECGACRLETFGTCSVLTSCPPGERALGAGDASITGPNGGSVTVPRRDGGYSGSFADPAMAWHPGDVLAFSVTGGEDVPAFRAQLALPPPVALVEPAIDAAHATATVAAGKPWSLRWTPAEGTVTVRVIPALPDGSRDLTCVFEGSAGTGTVPAAALDAVLAGIEATAVNALVAGTSLSSGAAGRVTLAAWNGVVFPVEARSR